MWVEEARDCKTKLRGRYLGVLAYFEGNSMDGVTRVHPAKWKAYDGEGITASLADGYLSITIPRAPAPSSSSFTSESWSTPRSRSPGACRAT